MQRVHVALEDGVGRWCTDGDAGQPSELGEVRDGVADVAGVEGDSGPG